MSEERKELVPRELLLDNEKLSFQFKVPMVLELKCLARETKKKDKEYICRMYISLSLMISGQLLAQQYLPRLSRFVYGDDDNYKKADEAKMHCAGKSCI